MTDIEYLINELRCDINYCKVSGDNDTEIRNAYETLEKLKEQVKKCSIPNVSQQRELLLGFQETEYFDLYEQGILEYKYAVGKYLAQS